MSELSPLDQGFNNLISGYDTRLRALETSRQPYQGDWIELNPGSVSQSGGKFYFESDPANFLSIGDRIRQNGTTYYVVWTFPPGNDSVGVISETMGSATGTVTKFEYSKLVAPSGFPGVFVQPLSSDGGGAGTITTFLPAPTVDPGITGSVYFYMIGTQVMANVSILGLTLSGAGTASTIYYDIGSFASAGLILRTIAYPSWVNDFGTYKHAVTKFDTGFGMMGTSMIGATFSAASAYDITAAFVYSGV